MSDKTFVPVASACIRMNIDPLKFIYAIAKNVQDILELKGDPNAELFLPKHSTLFATGQRDLVSAKVLLAEWDVKHSHGPAF